MQEKASNASRKEAGFFNFLLIFFWVPNYSHITSETAQKMPFFWPAIMLGPSASVIASKQDSHHT
jgi:hypothetical protein